MLCLPIFIFLLPQIFHKDTTISNPPTTIKTFFQKKINHIKKIIIDIYHNYFFVYLCILIQKPKRMKNLIDDIKRIRTLNEMIRSEKTGPPEKCAETMKCSPSAFFYLLRLYKRILRPHDVSIIFDEEFQTYRYSKRGSLVIEITFKED